VRSRGQRTSGRALCSTSALTNGEQVPDDGMVRYVGPIKLDVSRAYSNTQLDKLGERIRASASIDDADMTMLQALTTEHQHAIATVQGLIATLDPSLEQGGRVKTIGTMIDKLRRGTKLSRMQDFAGVRVVREMNRLEQVALTERIEALLPGSLRVDRIANPMFGYRALHIIASVDRCWIEVQVRTRDQHRWAEIVEKLGDSWGRQIRYGEEPTEPGKALIVETGLTRRELWAVVVSVGDSIDIAEAMVPRIIEMRKRAGTSFKPQLDELEQSLVGAQARYRQFLENLGALARATKVL
jgi:Region found in RelA / SpoT proteins